jgi:hypothetical protein
VDRFPLELRTGKRKLKFFKVLIKNFL